MEELFRSLVDSLSIDFACADPRGSFGCPGECYECDYYKLAITDFRRIINEYERRFYEV